MSMYFERASAKAVRPYAVPSQFPAAQTASLRDLTAESVGIGIFRIVLQSLSGIQSSGTFPNGDMSITRSYASEEPVWYIDSGVYLTVNWVFCGFLGVGTAPVTKKSTPVTKKSASAASSVKRHLSSHPSLDSSPLYSQDQKILTGLVLSRHQILASRPVTMVGGQTLASLPRRQNWPGNPSAAATSSSERSSEKPIFGQRQVSLRWGYRARIVAS